MLSSRGREETISITWWSKLVTGFRILRRTFSRMWYVELGIIETMTSRHSDFAYTPLDDTVSITETHRQPSPPPGLPGSAGDAPLIPVPVQLPTHSGRIGHNADKRSGSGAGWLFHGSRDDLLIICIRYCGVPCGPERARVH
jgi:hypothetical protein